jgi:Predicted AAA-ATPase
LTQEFPTPAIRDLIYQLYQRDLEGNKNSEHPGAVILIDEYDCPVIQALYAEDDSDEIGPVELAAALKSLHCLRRFHTILKGCDEYIAFKFITGSSRLAFTVSIHCNI